MTAWRLRPILSLPCGGRVDMPNDVPQRSREGIAVPLTMAAVYVYLALGVNPSLLYGQVPWFEQFSPEKGFFLARMGSPGGPSEYLGALIADFCLWRWFAALLLALLVCLLTWQAGWILERIGGAPVRQARIVVLFLCLLLMGRYSQQIASLVGLAITFAAAQLYLCVAQAPPWRRALAFCALTAALEWAVAGLLYIFLILAVVIEIRKRAHRLQILLYVMAIEGIPYLVGVVGLQAPLVDVFLRLLPLMPQTDYAGGYVLLALLLATPLLAAAGAVWAARHSRTAPGEPGTVPVTRELPPTRAAHSIALAAIFAGLLLVGFDRSTYHILVARQLAQTGQWERVIDEARKVPPEDFTFGIAHDVNRALAETGRLSSEMFSFAQNEDSLMLYNGGRGDPFRLLQSARRGILMEHGELALRMGLPNDAEHQFHEALEMFGRPPEALIGLARVNIVKGNLPAAYHFVRAAAEDPGYRPVARRMLAHFPDAVLSPEAVRQIRSTGLPGRRGYLPPFIDLTCLELLKHHPDDRFAYEYLMAYYLLQRDLKPFISQLKRLDSLGYTEIPRHWQEAILMHAAYTGTRPETAGHWLAPDVVQRSMDFLSTATPLIQAGKVEEAKAATRAAYGNSYFYYFTFGTSGGGSK